MGSRQDRGVNLGGWLLLEPYDPWALFSRANRRRWITPSIFETIDQTLGIVDEYTLCERLPHHAPQILREH
jgi:glucan 1,3-beta-glucosidase